MTSLPKISWLDQGQLERMVRLEKLPAFKGFTSTVQSSEVGNFQLLVIVVMFKITMSYLLLVWFYARTRKMSY